MKILWICALLSVLMLEDQNQAPTIPEILIGNQIWMATNLNVSHFRNGDPIPQAQSDEEWGQLGEAGKPAWCYYENDSTSDAKVGKLYNGYALTDPRGLAPEGWRTPSYWDWLRLIDQLGGDSLACVAIKSTEGWQANGNGRNSSGFNALPAGSRGLYGFFMYSGYYASWWTNTDAYKTDLWCISMGNICKKQLKYSESKDQGLSVRCIKSN